MMTMIEVNILGSATMKIVPFLNTKVQTFEVSGLIKRRENTGDGVMGAI